MFPVVAASWLSSSRSPVETRTVPAVQALQPGRSIPEELPWIGGASGDPPVEEEDESEGIGDEDPAALSSELGARDFRRNVEAMVHCLQQWTAS